MGQKKSEFDKVFSAWDILVIAFGAMIGWGWVVSSGTWIDAGGVVGAALAFAIGGVMIFFVGLTYAELTAAMPQCGGEHVFSYKAMGPTGSFICTWAIILGYVGVTCFEACAFPTIITYLWPGFLKGYLYTVAGFDIYASWLSVAIIIAFLIMMINIMGAKTAAVLQTVLTCIIGGAGILLIVASVINGNVDNLQGQMFMGETTGSVSCTCSCILFFCNPCSWLCSESGRDCTFAEYNRTGNCRCDGKSLWNLGDGKGYHRRWYVRYCYILELLYDRWFPCIVFYGRILHGSESICKTPSKAQNTGQCTDPDRYPYDDRSFRRTCHDGMDLRCR